MEVGKRRRVIFLAIGRDGNFYYKDPRGDKVVIGNDEQINNLTLSAISLVEKEYKNEPQYRALFYFLTRDPDEALQLDLNRRSHSFHLFVNKLCNADILKEMSLACYASKDDTDGSIHPIPSIIQSGQGIRGKFPRETYPPVDNGENSERSVWFEARLSELKSILEENPGTGVIYANAVETSPEIDYDDKVEREFKQFSESLPKSEAPVGDNDLPF